MVVKSSKQFGKCLENIFCEVILIGNSEFGLGYLHFVSFAQTVYLLFKWNSLFKFFFSNGKLIRLFRYSAFPPCRVGSNLSKSATAISGTSKGLIFGIAATEVF